MKIQAPTQLRNIFFDLRRLMPFVSLPCVAAALPLVWVVGGSRLTAQSQTVVNRGQPVLHVQATIVPVVVHDDHAAKWQGLAEDNNILPSDAPLPVIQGSSYESVKDEHGAGEKEILLRTTTIVPK